ncbi:hypothetical protein [Lentzea sp. CA-135723]|uniref:hypothetical protein n=1 Tax=Lentzea sp. CA-135723 TaxID=3239950 RepID=UPI003D8BF721
MVASENITGLTDQQWMAHWWFEMVVWTITAGLLIALPVTALVYRRIDRRAAERRSHGSVVYVYVPFVEQARDAATAAVKHRKEASTTADGTAGRFGLKRKTATEVTREFTENPKPAAIMSRLLDIFDRNDEIVHVSLASGEVKGGPALRGRLDGSDRPGAVALENLGGLFLFRGRFQVLDVAEAAPEQETEPAGNRKDNATAKTKALEKPVLKQITLEARFGGDLAGRRVRLEFAAETAPFPVSAECGCLAFVDSWDETGTTLDVTPIVVLR